MMSIQLTIVGALVVSITGRSPGALAMKTALLSHDSTRAPGLAKGLSSGLLYYLMALTLIGALLSALICTDGRGWIERITGTRSVDLTKPLDASSDFARRVGGRASRRNPSPPPAPEDLTRGVGAPNGFSAVGATTGSRTPPAPAPTAPQIPSAATYRPIVPVYPVDAGAGEGAAPPAEAPAPTGAPVPAAPPVRPGPSPSTPPAPMPKREIWAVMDSGDRELIDSTLVLGRAPSSDDPAARLVTIADSTRSLSRTHLRLGPTRSGVWVEDAFSANGTSARTPDGAIAELPRGQKRSVPIGTVLIMGERTLTITADSLRA
ncbi:MAG: hypothetical protein SPH79_07590 [Schaalia hyovaginalis]|uniref:hypothetical protein n=1 Tax=Schaalia hyovaginalis TaxID=29316 RepID=UPI002A917EE8|nr:hypothetical protein [Schaalia hyovaginalis]MDY6214336.1 hypothetical protein [Schaalia hyovaginalis]